ncbi:MAG: hypothetical protein B6D55_03630 [Candidatus Omnitrophica bacterium 4484_70.2]|nr:MAG: hypothetical protein B6D55_03630 [Candidatus Omnitrophica bacterium 4484_70.2]
MKVKVEKIGSEELKLEEDIFAPSWEMDSYDVKFVNNLHITCGFTRVEKEIMVKGSVLLHELIVCSRCLEEVEKEILLKFQFNYDIDSVGSYLDMDETIREHILLNFPMKVLCKPDCKGLCPSCGVNLNYQKCLCGRRA